MGHGDCGRFAARCASRLRLPDASHPRRRLARRPWLAVQSSHDWSSSVRGGAASRRSPARAVHGTRRTRGGHRATRDRFSRRAVPRRTGSFDRRPSTRGSVARRRSSTEPRHRRCGAARGAALGRLALRNSGSLIGCALPSRAASTSRDAISAWPRASSRSSTRDTAWSHGNLDARLLSLGDDRALTLLDPTGNSGVRGCREHRFRAPGAPECNHERAAAEALERGQRG